MHELVGKEEQQTYNPVVIETLENFEEHKQQNIDPPKQEDPLEETTENKRRSQWGISRP